MHSVVLVDIIPHLRNPLCKTGEYKCLLAVMMEVCRCDPGFDVCEEGGKVGVGGGEEGSVVVD